MAMTSRQRMLTALTRGVPDRLPVTTHHVMDYFLATYMHGMTAQEFFDHYEMDAWLWTNIYWPDPARGQYYDPTHVQPNFLHGQRVVSDQWRISTEEVPDAQFETVRYVIETPKGNLSMVVQSNVYTSWTHEFLIKDKRDIDLIAEYVPHPVCDAAAINRLADQFGERGLVRGMLCPFDIYGQAGCWQDACCLVGTERLIYETFDDPAWVHELLQVVSQRKETFLRSLKGVRFDLLEGGGGDASSTVISPRIFDEYVAPYDSKLIALAHEMGQRVVYHTCGGMMPFLERIAAMNPDGMETLTPPDMGGDMRLAEAKARIGDKVCLIGGFDQFHFFVDCTEEDTRAEVRRCFEEAGRNGGYILSPSDHFFDADPELIAAFADEAHRCVYRRNEELAEPTMAHRTS